MRSGSWNGARTFRGIVHHVDGPVVHASRGRGVFRSDDAGASWTSVARLPLDNARGLASWSRLGRRLFRSYVYHLRPLEPGRTLALAFGSVYVIDEGRREARRVAPLVGSRPLALCASGGQVFYGEYRGNPERSPIRIWRSRDGGEQWDAAFTFPGTVRHVHGVFADPFEGGLWVTTGDADAECAIWRSRDDCASLERVVAGTQQARVVTLLFDAGAIYFGSDAVHEPNHIYRLDRRTGAVERLHAVEGPVFYGCSLGGRHFLSTVREPSRVNQAPYAALWMTDERGQWHRALTARKDRWPMRLFQYGQFLFPSGRGDAGYLWCTPFATEGDQTSVRLEIAALTGDSHE